MREKLFQEQFWSKIYVFIMGEGGGEFYVNRGGGKKWPQSKIKYSYLYILLLIPKWIYIYERSSNVIYEWSPNIIYERSPNVIDEWYLNVIYERSSNVIYEWSPNVIYERSPNVIYDKELR